jgi:hemerythrin-like domain-containing protein
MNAVQILEHEHEAILFGIGLLEKVGALAAAGDATAKADLPELLRFLKGFADTCHHGKEEGLLFPAMEAAGIANEDGPLGVMLAEHRQGRIHLKGMIDAVESADYGLAFKLSFDAYAALLRAHIDKENAVLFPLGSKVLGAPRLELMGKDFDAFEEDVMGKGEHERLHAMLEDFSARYKRP